MTLVLALVGDHGRLLPTHFVPVLLVGALLLVLTLLLVLASTRGGIPPGAVGGRAMVDLAATSTPTLHREDSKDDLERTYDATRYPKGDPGDEPPEDKFPWR